MKLVERKGLKILVLLACIIVVILTISFVMFLSLDHSVANSFIYLLDERVPPRQIQNTEAFDVRWQQTLVSQWLWGMEDPNEKRIFMYIDEDQVIVPVWNMNLAYKKNISLNSFELEFGEVSWQTNLDVDSKFSVDENSGIIFILATDIDETRRVCDPDIICRVFKISAYDVNTGTHIWEVYPHELYNNEKGFLIQINNERIHLISKGKNPQPPITVCLDAKTGMRLSDCNKFEFGLVEDVSFPLFFSTANDFDENNIVSNVAYNNDLIFFVTIPDNRLWAVDKDSFMKVGWIEFDGAPIERGNYYNVVANEDTVVVYMADSHQLIAFDLQISD